MAFLDATESPGGGDGWLAIPTPPLYGLTSEEVYARSRRSDSGG